MGKNEKQFEFYLHSKQSMMTFVVRVSCVYTFYVLKDKNTFDNFFSMKLFFTPPQCLKNQFCSFKWEERLTKIIQEPNWDIILKLACQQSNLFYKKSNLLWISHIKSKQCVRRIAKNFLKQIGMYVVEWSRFLRIF